MYISEPGAMVPVGWPGRKGLPNRETKQNTETAYSGFVTVNSCVY